MTNPDNSKATGVLIGSNRSGERVRLNKIVKDPSRYNSRTLNKDAKVLHFLKSECQDNGTGAVTLQKVINGITAFYGCHPWELEESLNEKEVK